MRKPSRRWLAVAALVLGGCAAGYKPTPYWAIKESSLAALRPGVSTKEDVRRTIGLPLSEVYFPRQKEEVWEYRYIEGTTVVMLADVHFTSDGRYKYMFRRLDPSFHGGPHD